MPAEKVFHTIEQMQRMTHALSLLAGRVGSPQQLSVMAEGPLDVMADLLDTLRQLLLIKDEETHE